MSEPPKNWKEPFEQGIASYKSKSYGEALIAFDLALKVGGKRVAVLDSRAAVLEKLGRLKDALQDARGVIELTPTSSKGYLRSSHLFELLNRIPQAHQMLLLAIPLSPSSNLASLRARQSALDAKLLLYQKSKANHIQTLPAEILTSIGHLLVNSDSDVALRLAGVSSRWRSIFLDDAKVWSRLKLGRKRSLPKAKAFWERSKGLLVALEMDGVPGELAGKVMGMVNGSFGRLKVFRWRVEQRCEIGPELQRWRGRFRNLRHLRLELWPGDFNGRVATIDLDLVWNLLVGPCVLETLDLRNLNTPTLIPPPHLGSISSIKHLNLSSYTLLNLPTSSPENDLSHFLDLVPNLETIALPNSQGRFIKTPNHRTSDVQMLSLKRLSVLASAFSPLEPISMPSLERADFTLLTWPAFSVLIPLDPTTGDPLDVNVRHLTHLNLTRAPIIEGLVVDYLNLIPTLTHLVLASCNVTNATFENLVLSSEGEGCIPLLEHLDMSYSAEVTGGPVCRMVASRKGRGRDGRGLRSLVLDGCPLIEVKAVDWLMEKVERFSCKIVLEKKKR
ncbi:hypothetical protein BDY24DRAFT_439014 [Mrakia frigida]|uniref:tetratricopeptide repeat protein n=1 Tax=Mrakia frigida TaxID=29902 RepID=UPI003FCC155E